MTTALFDVLGRVLADVRDTLIADWPYLLASILAVAPVTTYVGVDRLAGWLRHRRWTRDHRSCNDAIYQGSPGVDLRLRRR